MDNNASERGVNDDNNPDRARNQSIDNPDSALRAPDLIDDKDESRQLTQTDHLNQKLLRSFLDNINRPNSGFPQVARFDTEENADIDNEQARFNQ